MMSEQVKRRVLFNGKLVDGEPVRIQAVVSEPWTEYLLSDGSVLRARVIFCEATRLEVYDAEGGPIYASKLEIVRNVSYPESLRHPPPGSE